MFHQTHFKHFVESESFCWGNLKTNFSRNLIPMTFDHSFLPESYHQRNFGLELIQLTLNQCGYFKNRLNISFLEESHARSNSSHTVINKPFSCRSIKSLPFSMHPLLNIFKPFVTNHPKITVGSELFDHTTDFIVISLIQIEKTFS